MSAASAIKKRKVVFAAKDHDADSNSGESCTFEVMDLDVSIQNHVGCISNH